MKNIICAHDDFESLKKRWEHFKKNSNDDNLDKHIAPLVHAMGSRSGIVPVWSCSSHPEMHNNRLHVVMAVNENGLNDLVEVFDRYKQITTYPYGLYDKNGNEFYPYAGDIDEPGVKLNITRLIRSDDMLPFKKNEHFWSGMEWEAIFYNEHSYEAIDKHVQKVSKLFMELKPEANMKINGNKIKTKNTLNNFKTRPVTP